MPDKAFSPQAVAVLDGIADDLGMARVAEPPKLAPAKPGGKTLAGVIGVAAAAILAPLVMQWEGEERTAYKDIVGVWTICYGDTKNVTPGTTETPEQCKARLERQLIAHAEPVVKCTPNLIGRPNALAAAASLAYNIGPTAYCKSTVDRLFDAGDIKGGCNAFLAWRFAGGKEVKGLLNRRKAEQAICLKDA
nr:lysozyme [uncultured Sphingomonas sp.]